MVLANLKPRNMRGVKSCGMLLCASDSSHENVEPLVPPKGSVPGDRVWFGNEEDLEQLPEPSPPNKVFYLSHCKDLFIFSNKGLLVLLVIDCLFGCRFRRRRCGKLCNRF